MTFSKFKRVLVANRAEIASRVFRTAKEMGLETVALYSDVDIELPYVNEATFAVNLPGVSPKDTYLNIEKILRAVEVSQADAVHPGYGFLSENAEFAKAIEKLGVTFIGPTPETIAQMGSKTKAKEIMSLAGVPTLPQVIFDSNTKVTVDQFDELPFPLLVKAAFGGGGRGMRIIRDSSELISSIEIGQQEALSAFGSAQVFVEPYIESPRHIEVQILGDRFGDVVHLFERECSIQRRYQKIIEESPSPFLTERTRELLLETAVRAGKAVSYIGAGTVEFIFAPDGTFYFLEMNTRLQVEHPVTEYVTGVDLVKEQLHIAMGEPISDTAKNARSHGWAIEARLYAEDPLENYSPQAGNLARFEIDNLQVRVDSGFRSGSNVSSFYDAMLAKVIAHRSSRIEAASSLELALRSAKVAGVPTNIDLLRGILTEQEFLNGKIDTAYLERNDPAKLAHDMELDASELDLYLAALVMFRVHQRTRSRRSLPVVRYPWRNVKNADFFDTLVLQGNEIKVSYRYSPEFKVQVGSRKLSNFSVKHVGSDYIEVEAGSIFQRITVVELPREAFCVIGPKGSINVSVKDRFPGSSYESPLGSLLAPMPGTVVEVRAKSGDHVDKGMPLLVLEAMKMQHVISAPTSGVIGEIRVRSGDQVTLGTLLAVVDEEPESKV